MFYYKYPIFEKKKLLRIEMLEQMRDYPRNLERLYMKTMSDGIVTGCDVSWFNDELVIQPGLLYRAGKIYVMDKEEKYACPPQGKRVFVKVIFSAESREESLITGMGRIQISDIPAASATELELCRFHLQNGAKLRCQYESFKDYSTEYNTLNRIDTPFSDDNDPVLWPRMMEQFAKEMLSKNPANVTDSMFAIQVLGNHGVCSRTLLVTYLNSRILNMKKSWNNQELYQELLNLLNSAREERGQNESWRSRNMVLI